MDFKWSWIWIMDLTSGSEWFYMDADDEGITRGCVRNKDVKISRNRGRFSRGKVSSHKPSEWKFLAAEPSFKSVKRQAGYHSNPFESNVICPASKCFNNEHPKDPVLNQCSPKAFADLLSAMPCANHVIASDQNWSKPNLNNFQTCLHF